MKVAITPTSLVLAFSVLCVGFTACAGSGFSSAVRTDVQDRMSSAQPKLAACYAKALKRNRKVEGTLVVSFVAVANSGNFQDVHVVRSDIADPELDSCVVSEVGALKLQTPAKNQVAVEYPIAFLAHE